MVDDINGTVRELDIPFTVSPSGGGLFVVQSEESRSAYVILSGYTPSLDAEARQECVALFTVRKVVQSVFGYPNEEAYWHDPRGKIAKRVVEIVGSKWADEIDSYNERTYGTALPWPQTRHFFLGSKDASVQFLASGIAIDLFSEPPMSSAFQQAKQIALKRLGAPDP